MEEFVVVTTKSEFSPFNDAIIQNMIIAKRKLVNILDLIGENEKIFAVFKKHKLGTIEIDNFDVVIIKKQWYEGVFNILYPWPIQYFDEDYEEIDNERFCMSFYDF